MDTGFAVFKLRVLESLVHSDSMADLKGSMSAIIRSHDLNVSSIRAGTTQDGGGSEGHQDDGSGAPLTVQMTLNTLKESLAQHGARGIHGLARKFKIMDDDGTGNLNLEEFQKAMKEHSMGLSAKVRRVTCLCCKLSVVLRCTMVV